MNPSDLTIDVAQWGLKIASLRASVAANNIAQANTSGELNKVDFEKLIGLVNQAVQNGDSQAAVLNMSKSVNIMDVRSDSLFGGTSLDDQVVELSSAKGKYKVIADALAKKYGLMSIAGGGK